MRHCPVENTPDFKTCRQCEECAVLREWVRQPPPLKASSIVIALALIIADFLDHLES